MPANGSLLSPEHSGYSTARSIRRRTQNRLSAWVAAAACVVRICPSPLLLAVLLLVLVNIDPSVAAKEMGTTERFLAAAEAGDQKLIETMLAEGVSADQGEEEGTPALHVASYKGHLSIVETLLEHGAEVDLRAMNGRTALHLAALKGHSPVVATLLEQGATSDPRDEEGVTPLGLAAISCHLEAAQLLIEHGADVNTSFEDGWTALHGLPYSKNAERRVPFVRLLIASGADVHAETTNERNTPLQLAALFGDPETAELLLEAGADLESANALGDRPLHSASMAGQDRLVTLFLAHGAEVDVADASGMTPLLWAAARGEMKRGRNVHDFITWRRGGNPLPHDYVATARKLIEHGASLDARDQKGRDAFKFAKKRGDPKMIQLLEATAARN